jgi:hypothetical protein
MNKIKKLKKNRKKWKKMEKKGKKWKKMEKNGKIPKFVGKIPKFVGRKIKRSEKNRVHAYN